MSEREKAEIMTAVAELPENDKQFVLGYMTGVASKAAEKPEKGESDDTGRDKKQ